MSSYLAKDTAFTRFRKGYLTFALVTANSLVIFVLLNLVLGAMLYVRSWSSRASRSKPVVALTGSLFNEDGSPVNNGKRSSYQLQWIDFKAYENVSAENVSAMLDDFTELSKLGFIYQPWVEFSEPPFKGKLVNVDLDERGFTIRRTINPPNSPAVPTIRILALGGSTTFGYNVADEHTWPSYLSMILNERAKSQGINVRIEVLNYGRGYYNTSQETVLLLDLLKSGQRPNLVLFMDGLNWPYFEDASNFTGILHEKFRNIQFASNRSSTLWERLDWIPAVYVANVVKRRLFPAAPAAGNINTNSDEGNPPYDLIVNRFDQNKRITLETCRIYSVTPLFFTQPNPIYNYSLDLYRPKVPDSFSSRRSQTARFYSMMREREGTIYLGDLFESFGHRKAVVDDVHYSPAFNEFLASHVAANIDLKKLVPRPAVFDATESTGTPRSTPQSE